MHVRPAPSVLSVPKYHGDHSRQHSIIRDGDRLEAAQNLAASCLTQSHFLSRQDHRSAEPSLILGSGRREANERVP